MFCLNCCMAQHSTELGIYYSLSSESLVTKNKILKLESQLFHSIGIQAKHNFNARLFISGGFNLKPFGVRLPDEQWKARGLEIPVGLGYYFFHKKNIQLGASVGLSSLFLVEQTREAKGLIAKLDMYKNFFFSYKSALHIRLKMKNGAILNILPFWQKQWNPSFLNYRQRGIGLELGISYELKK